MEQQEATIDALRDEIKALQAQNKQLRDQASSSDDKNDMKAYVDEVAQQSATELNNLKNRYEKRITAYKAAANEAKRSRGERNEDLIESSHMGAFLFLICK